MAEHDGKPDIEDIIAPSEAEGFIAWTHSPPWPRWAPRRP